MYTIVEFIKTHIDAVLPTYETPGSAGMDLRSVSPATVLASGQRMLVQTGLKIALEHGYEAQVRSKSGLALNKGLVVLNSPGTIDSDYRGGVGVILINHGTEPVQINPGDKIAQMVVKPVCTQVRLKEVEKFSDPDTERGEGGYGSTGK